MWITQVQISRKINIPHNLPGAHRIPVSEADPSWGSMTSRDASSDVGTKPEYPGSDGPCCIAATCAILPGTHDTAACAVAPYCTTLPGSTRSQGVSSWKTQ